MELAALREKRRHLLGRQRVRLLVGVGFVLAEVEALDPFGREMWEREPPLPHLKTDSQPFAVVGL